MVRLKLAERRPLRFRLAPIETQAPAIAFGNFLTESLYGLSPAGSWENTRDQLQRMLEQSEKLGGPIVPYGEDPDNYEVTRPGDISIAASYPDQSKVLVSNYRTGEYWMVPYTLGEDGTLAIGDPSPAELEVAAKTKEALRTMRESGRKSARAYPVRLDVRLKEAKFNDDDTVEVMAIREGCGNPVDNNYYDKNFIESLVPLLDGAQSHLDHPTLFDEKNIPERSVQTLSGWFSDARVGTWTDPEHTELGEVAAAFATFHPVVGDERTINLLRTCREKFEKFPDKEPFVGYSIVAYGVGAPGEINGQNYNIVSLCTQLRSVDMVTQAGAAGRPMMESTRVNPKKKTESGKRIDPNLPARTKAQIEADKDAFFLETRRATVRDLLGGPAGKALAEAASEKPDSAGNFTNDQVDKIADKAGFVKGGKMHKALEDALVTDDMDPEDEPQTPSGEKKEGDDDALTPEKIDAMSDAEKTAALKKSIGAQESGGKTKREIELEKKLAAQEARIEKLETTMTEANRKSVFQKVCDEIKMPDVYRPLVERMVKDATSNDEIAEIVHAYFNAHVIENGRPVRGAVNGNRVQESRGNGAVTPPKYTKAR